MEAPDIIYTDGKNTCAPAPVFSNIDGNIKYIRADLTEQPKVDLEKEIKNYLATKCAGDDEPSVSEIARHFFELGLSAGMEKSNGVNGVVHHAIKSHWIVTDKNKLAAILKAFPEGAEVELFVCAKKEKNDK